MGILNDFSNVLLQGMFLSMVCPPEALIDFRQIECTRVKMLD